MAKTYIKLWDSYSSYFEPLGAAEVGRLVLAMMKYKSSGVEPEFSGSEKFIWPAIRRDLDEDIAYTDRKAKQVKESRNRKRENETTCNRLQPIATGCNRMQPNETECNSIRNKDIGLRTKDVGNRTEDITICAEPETVSAPPVIELPLNDGTLYPISQEQCQEWAGLYPAVNVIQQLRQMRGWLDSNPTKRKTIRGIKRFVAGWLARTQDKGGDRHDDQRDPEPYRLNVTRL